MPQIHCNVHNTSSFLPSGPPLLIYILVDTKGERGIGGISFATIELYNTTGTLTKAELIFLSYEFRNFRHYHPHFLNKLINRIITYGAVKVIIIYKAGHHSATMSSHNSSQFSQRSGQLFDQS